MWECVGWCIGICEISMVKLGFPLEIPVMIPWDN